MSTPKRATKPKAAPAAKRPPSVEGSEVVGVRIPHDVLAPLDARVASLNASGDVPSKVTRAGLILHLVRSAVAEWKRAEKGGGA